MTAEILSIRSRPQIKLIRDLQSPNCVRTYRVSPEDVCVQIRGEKRIASASLTFDEAREFAAMILAAVNSGRA